MKNNLSTIVLAIGLAVLYILHFSSNGEADVAVDDSTELQDSLKTDSLTAQLINPADSSFMDSLKIAEYSKVGYLDIAMVVQMCPVLKKDQLKVYNVQKSIAGRKDKYEDELRQYMLVKQSEYEKLQNSGLMTQSSAARIQQEVALKEQELQGKMRDLNMEFNTSKEQEAKLSQKLDDLVGRGLEIINKKVKLDYILIEKRELSTVYALNKKNDITEAMIKLINSNGVK